MSEKFRFKLNLFDGIVLAVALCVGGVLGYTALKPAAPAQTPDVPGASVVRYTVRFNKMMAGTEALVEPGDELIDNIKNYKIGTVVSTQAVPAVTPVLDEESRQVVQAEIPGYVDLLVDVECTRGKLGANAVELDGGFVLRVNSIAYIKGEGYMASGPIISIEREGQA